MKQAEWIAKRLPPEFAETPDDVYDVLLGNIQIPRDFVAEVNLLAIEYGDMIRHRL